MKEFSVPLSLFDFLPVVLFTLSSVILSRDLYNKMSKGAFALYAAGTCDVIAAGFLKALYKLMYAIGLCDFSSLDSIFFPLQSLGFILSGLGLFALVTHRQTKDGKERRSAVIFRSVVYASLAVIVAVVTISGMKGLEREGGVPPYFSGTFLFVTLMITGLLLMEISLVKIAFSLSLKPLLVLYIISFISSLMMGYLSSQDFTVSLYNWIGEGVNTLGQASFFLSSLIMHKKGLEELVLEEEQ